MDTPDFWIPHVAVILGLLAAALFQALTWRYARRRQSRLAELMARHATRPLLLLLPVLFGRVVQPLMHLQPAVAPAVRHIVTLLLIFGLGWLLIALISVLDEYLREGIPSGLSGAGRARILTRMGVLFRVLTAAVILVTAAAMLITFPEVRAIGTSILASAGIAGVILGIAARPGLEGLMAGLHVALTEPFHLDDTVVVEGDQGRVEEITSTYVVLALWDGRRVVVPLAYFLQKPFQNLSRSATGLLAAVTLEVDYSTPVAALREEVGRLVAASKLWDGQSWNLQVTEAGERTIQLRAVASAVDPARQWDLRCEIREKLVQHVQERYPWALPRVRSVTAGDPPSGPAAES